MSIFKIDGKSYNVFVPVGGLQRNFAVYSSQSETLVNGKREYDVIGTYIEYTVTVDTSYATEEEYDELFEIISSPTAEHQFEFPYGQKHLTFTGHVESGGDTLYTKRNYGLSGWGDLSFTVTATEPQRKAIT